MSALTTRQQAFVRAMLETGGSNNTRAARLAGFSGDDDCMRATAYRLAHDPKVLAALREEADRRIRSGAVLGASVLLEIASDTTHKDRYKAAIELLNRSGLMVVTEHKVTVTNTADEKQQIARIVDMAGKLGIDPKKLLGEFVDAEYTEVVATDVPTPAAAQETVALPAPMAGTEGLEDIL